MTSTPHRTILRRGSVALGVLVGLYLALAYGLLPALWRHYEHQPDLANRPMVTRTTQDIPGDPINVGLVGTKEEVIRAFAAARWDPADAITLASSIEIGASVILDRPDASAPVSTLLFDGRKQDLAFEKPVGTSADRRHHVRFWRVLEKGAEGRPVWLGAASFDIGVGLSRDTGQITHHIAPDVDADRDLVIRDLLDARMLVSTYQVSGVGPTLNGRNGGGDRYYTDGEVTIGVISPRAAITTEAAQQLPNPPATRFKHWVWSFGIWIRDLFR
ncbi:LssY C-terminal domain-containing protein [Microvirga antarctica]|uniref:LssY C-terminal domain-containing protein n=1 Tax=Microvirga antarctica TaxID=2819233 RepID=UPI001B302594|nr:LssY C-terminal domain-containing protein [Microvirga antarctica]